MFEDMWLARVEEIEDLCCDACEPVKSGAPATSHKCKGAERSNWWGKGFDNAARQGDKDNINGYRSKAFGVMLAYDKPINNEAHRPRRRLSEYPHRRQQYRWQYQNSFLPDHGLYQP